MSSYEDGQISAMKEEIGRQKEILGAIAGLGEEIAVANIAVLRLKEKLNGLTKELKESQEYGKRWRLTADEYLGIIEKLAAENDALDHARHMQVEET